MIRPNILYLHSHDTGRYIQPYGYPVETPHLQAFAEQGVLFRHAFAASPTCSPSRAALLTGQYPHCCGMHGLANPAWGYRLDDPARHLSHQLNAAGYLTALAGVQHLAKAPVSDIRSLGYQVFLHENDLGEDVPDTHELAAGFIAKNTDRPWYLAVGFDETHRDNRQGNPLTGARFSKHTRYDPATLDSRYCRAPAIFPDLPEIRSDWASFQAGVKRLDERIGHVLTALHRSGEADHTIVLITTDHGIAWPDMKCNLTDHGLGVMLLIRGPGEFSGGRVVDALTTHLDVYPTLCDLIGIDRPRWLQGSSLLPLVRGEIANLHDAIYAEQGWHEVAEAQRAVRTQRFKYIRRFDSIGPKAVNCDEGPAKRLLQEAGWFDRHLGRELLFDLYLDPQERCNVAAIPAHCSTLQDLRGRLDDWMNRTNDPLLSGLAVPPPAQI